MERLRVVGHRDLLGKGSAVGGLVADERALLTDTLTVTLGDHLLIIHVDQLIFQAGAACVDNKNFHRWVSFRIVNKINLRYNIL